MTLRRPLLIFVVTLLAVLGLDQFTKSLVRAYLPLQDSRLLLPGLLYLTHVENVGAAFGVFPGQRAVFVAVSLSVVFVIIVYMVRQRPTSPLVVVALGLVCAGALGNLIDRTFAIPGWHTTFTVTDFLEFGFIRFPVFNVADSAIVLGVGLLVLWLLFSPTKPGEPLAAGQEPVEVADPSAAESDTSPRESDS